MSKDKKTEKQLDEEIAKEYDKDGKKEAAKWVRDGKA